MRWRKRIYDDTTTSFFIRMMTPTVVVVAEKFPCRVGIRKKKIRQKFFGLAEPILKQFFFKLQKEDCYLLFDEFLAFLIEYGSHTQIL